MNKMPMTETEAGHFTNVKWTNIIQIYISERNVICECSANNGAQYYDNVDVEFLVVWFVDDKGTDDTHTHT